MRERPDVDAQTPDEGHPLVGRERLSVARFGIGAADRIARAHDADLRPRASSPSFFAIVHSTRIAARERLRSDDPRRGTSGQPAEASCCLCQATPNEAGMVQDRGAGRLSNTCIGPLPPPSLAA